MPRQPTAAGLGWAGPLTALLTEPGVTDVLVNSPRQVFVDRGLGLERAEVAFGDEEEVRGLAVRLVTLAGRRLDDACPCADAVLADGTRVHAVLYPVAPDGTALSLRLPRPVALEFDDLIRLGTVDAEMAPWLEAILAARLSFLVSGSAGSGKTTVLSALLGRVAPADRLVLVEDTAELSPAHPHVVRLTARPANIEGVGAITIRELVRQALRMRPDRLVVGEARGAEVLDLLAAFNTGHDGGAATVHANSAAQVPARLEALAATGGARRAELHSQLAAGVQAVLHLERDPRGRRRLVEIGVPRRWANGLVALQVGVRRRAAGLEAGPGLCALTRMLAQRGVTAPVRS